MNNINRDIADKTAAIIIRSGRTLSGVAAAAGIPKSTFDRKIKGTTPFTAEELARVADALSVSPLDLLPESFSIRAAA